jgi:hypothetical protein
MDDQFDARGQETHRRQQEIEVALRTIIKSHARWEQVAAMPAPTGAGSSQQLNEARVLLRATLDAIDALLGLTVSVMEECNERTRTGKEAAGDLQEASDLIARAELLLQRGVTLAGQFLPADPEVQRWASSVLAFIGDDGPPVGGRPEVVH